MHQDHTPLRRARHCPDTCFSFSKQRMFPVPSKRDNLSSSICSNLLARLDFSTLHDVDPHFFPLAIVNYIVHGAWEVTPDGCESTTKDCSATKEERDLYASPCVNFLRKGITTVFGGVDLSSSNRTEEGISVLRQRDRGPSVMVFLS